jgi:hypothetical protein
MAQSKLEINMSNWQSHPEIETIRKIYQEIEKQVVAKKLVQTRREYEYCEPYADITREMYKDSSGRIMKYVKDGGSDDSTRKISFYYDVQGKLRFAFIEAGAVNGSHLEHRIYFRADGKRIWENHKYSKGPGYTFPEVWEDNDLVFSPAEAFVSKNECPLVNSK